METRHLKYFIAVAEELSFTKAALKLHIAQPPLSQQIKILEEEVGTQLFDRSKRQITLTKEGIEFLSEAKKIIMSLDGLKNKMAEVSSGERSEIRVGFVSAMASIQFAALLRKFKKNNPEINIVLMESPSTWQINALESGEIDVSFLSAPGMKLKSFDSFLIKKDMMKLAVPENHPLAKKNKIKWKDLKDENFILVDQNIVSPGYYKEFYELCSTDGFMPQITQYTKNVVSQMWMVSAGLGLAPMPTWPDMKGNNQGVKLISLPNTKVLNEVSMSHRKNENSLAINKFIKFVKESY